MNLSVTFKNLDPSDRMKFYLQDKLDRLDKLIHNPGSADAVLRAEKSRNIVEINLSADRLDIHAKEEHIDMLAAIDLVLDKVKKQLIRSKDKLQAHRVQA
jgi:putative sigma-54 modulation protein